MLRCRRRVTDVDATVTQALLGITGAPGEVKGTNITHDCEADAFDTKMMCASDSPMTEEGPRHSSAEDLSELERRGSVAAMLRSEFRDELERRLSSPKPCISVASQELLSVPAVACVDAPACVDARLIKPTAAGPCTGARLLPKRSAGTSVLALLCAVLLLVLVAPGALAIHRGRQLEQQRRELHELRLDLQTSIDMLSWHRNELTQCQAERIPSSTRERMSGLRALRPNMGVLWLRSSLRQLRQIFEQVQRALGDLYEEAMISEW